MADLAAEAGVARHIRLTTSTTLSSPVAFGTRHPEICLPARARDALEPALLEAMLAHEVAHVARHDAAWLRAYRVTTTLLFFQPLNLLAVRNLHDTAEMLCDAWAAREQGRRVALARCLTAVADWILERPAPHGVSAMALRPSLLGRRVELLVAGDASERIHGRGTTLVAALPLLVVLALAPGLKGASSPNGESVSDTDSSFGVLDGELGALAVEMEELQALLIDAGHPELADRLENRRRSLTLERDHLRQQTAEPLSLAKERDER